MERTRSSLVTAAILVAIVVSASAGQGTPQTQPAGAQRPGLPVRDAARPAPKGTSRIRGRVITSDTGAPLRRAQVTLFSSEIVLRRMATTDGQGRYEFSELPEGRFVVSATKGGFVTLQYGQRRPFEAGRPIALGDGQTIEQIDLALPRGGVIVGHVTDEFGEAITGVQVQAQRLQYGPGGERRPIFTAMGSMTDDLGQFRVFGLMPGEYVLNAVARMPFGLPQDQGGATDSVEGYAPTYYPGTANPAEAQSITVGLAQEVALNFSLLAAHMSRISGTAVDSQGRPAIGAMVNLVTTTDGGGTTMFGGQTTTDGSFTLGNVPPGNHSVSVRVTPKAPGDQAEFASVPITISGQDVSGLRVTTGPGTSVTGTVVFEGTSSRVGGTGPLRMTAIPGTRQPSASITFGSGYDSGLIAEDGSFELKGLAGFSALFRASTPAAWTLKSVSLNGDDITDVPTELTGMKQIAGLRVVFTDRLTNITGAVTGNRGEMVKDFVVVVRPAEEPDDKAGMAITRYVRVTRADQEGHFAIRGLPPGRYLAAAAETLEQGREWDPEFLRAFRGAARAFTVAEGETVALSLALAPIQ